MQNKPNFRKAKMNANAFSTMNYKDFIPLAGYKNKPKQSQFQIGSQKSDVRSQKPDYLLSVLCSLFSVLCFLMQPKLLNFHRKNSLTAWLNSVKLSFL
jgi:hypothetical protein